MAKKSTIAKVPEPGEPTASKPVTKAKKPRKAAAKPAAVAPKATKSGLSAAPVTAPAAAAAITDADIALRAYYIAEKRQKLGIPGDSTSDWVEAERQLKAEAKAK